MLSVPSTPVVCKRGLLMSANKVDTREPVKPYVPALGSRWLTRFYDPLITLLEEENSNGAWSSKWVSNLVTVRSIWVVGRPRSRSC